MYCLMVLRLVKDDKFVAGVVSLVGGVYVVYEIQYSVIDSFLTQYEGYTQLDRLQGLAAVFGGILEVIQVGNLALSVAFFTALVT